MGTLDDRSGKFPVEYVTPISRNEATKIMSQVESVFNLNCAELIYYLLLFIVLLY